MKRDMDLVREILIQMEGWGPEVLHPDITIDGYTREEIVYNVGLMSEAGLIKAACLSSNDGEDWMPLKILWAGHEFLDAARSETIWKKAKELVLKNSGTLTIEAMKVALTMVMNHAITGTLDKSHG